MCGLFDWWYECWKKTIYMDFR